MLFRSGHKVVVKLLGLIEKNRYRGEVVKIIGHRDDPGVDILSIVYKYEDVYKRQGLIIVILIIIVVPVILENINTSKKNSYIDIVKMYVEAERMARCV